ncbi:carbonic anhydrase [Anaerobacillus arseniciselenatis]|uniref:carbonic anhydrase n=1 Tax=Anaerobacillus arseniciselenatis TaxID=85682 RepID=A0A1S2LHF8_9BACI|nr:carbonic anhydrase [Anaerobacillus arseniciselenatis]OIJ11660.1 carbonic anhydrase [Anaerobacillus arseniciselenatis]
MRLLEEILQNNESFVQERKFEPYLTTKFPDKKLVIVTCMDTRLTEMLPQALNLKNGDAKIIKNAGAVISHPFGSIMRSIIVAIYALKAEEVCIIGHHGCGMAGLEANVIMDQVEERGIDNNTIETLHFSGVDIKSWLKGFSSVEESVSHSVEMVKKHPLLPKEIPVHGLVIDPDTGKLDLVVNGYELNEMSAQ